MNDSFFLGKINTDKTLADQLGRGPGEDAAKIRRMFLTVLSRSPTDKEMQAALEHVKSEEKPLTAYRNLLWVLLNTKEFMFVN
jgi:hypothetical protein